MSNVKLFEDMTNNFKEFSVLMEKMKSSITPPPPPPGGGGPSPYFEMNGKLYEASGGSLPSKYLSSEYGWRWGRIHQGVDYATKIGTPVSAIQPGKVVSAGWNSGGYGNVVEIEHTGGTRSFYAHLNQVSVANGQQITPGTVIGNVGSTGNSTGPHVHFEIRQGGRAIQIPSNEGDKYFRFGGNIKLKEVEGPKGKMTIEELLELAKRAGFKGKDAEVAAAVAMAESSGIPTNHNDNYKRGGKDDSYGLWQINMLGDMGPDRRRKFGISKNEQLFNPLVNARAAYLLSGGSNFGAWTVYRKGLYLKHLPAAEKANRKKSGQGGSNLMNESIRPVNKSYNNLSSSSSYTSDSTSMFVIARQVVEKPVVIPMPIPMKTSTSPSDNNKNISLSDLWTV
jgi:hypothetical protein